MPKKSIHLLKITLLIALSFFYSCSDKPDTTTSKPQVTEVDTTATVKPTVPIVRDKKVYTCNDCLKLVRELVYTSGYNSYFETKYRAKYSVVLESATKQKVTVQIIMTDKDAVETPMGWLELDLVNAKLWDITNDPENPVAIEFDNKLYDLFKQNCMQCCLD